MSEETSAPDEATPEPEEPDDIETVTVLNEPSVTTTSEGTDA